MFVYFLDNTYQKVPGQKLRYPVRSFSGRREDGCDTVYRDGFTLPKPFIVSHVKDPSFSLCSITTRGRERERETVTL